MRNQLPPKVTHVDANHPFLALECCGIFKRVHHCTPGLKLFNHLKFSRKIVKFNSVGQSVVAAVLSIDLFYIFQIYYVFVKFSGSI